MNAIRTLLVAVLLCGLPAATALAQQPDPGDDENQQLRDRVQQLTGQVEALTRLLLESSPDMARRLRATQGDQFDAFLTKWDADYWASLQEACKDAQRPWGDRIRAVRSYLAGELPFGGPRAGEQARELLEQLYVGWDRATFEDTRELARRPGSFPQRVALVERYLGGEHPFGRPRHTAEAQQLREALRREWDRATLDAAVRQSQDDRLSWEERKEGLQLYLEQRHEFGGPRFRDDAMAAATAMLDAWDAQVVEEMEHIALDGSRTWEERFAAIEAYLTTTHPYGAPRSVEQVEGLRDRLRQAAETDKQVQQVGTAIRALLPLLESTPDLKDTVRTLVARGHSLLPAETAEKLSGIPDEQQIVAMVLDSACRERLLATEDRFRATLVRLPLDLLRTFLEYPQAARDSMLAEFGTNPARLRQMVEARLSEVDDLSPEVASLALSLPGDLRAAFLALSAEQRQQIVELDEGFRDYLLDVDPARWALFLTFDTRLWAQVERIPGAHASALMQLDDAARAAYLRGETITSEVAKMSTGATACEGGAVSHDGKWLVIGGRENRLWKTEDVLNPHDEGPAALLDTEGTIEESDPRSPATRSRIDWHEVEGQAGIDLKFSLDSDEFDTFLLIESPGAYGRRYYDDDSGGDGNSMVRLTVRTTGIYRIGVTSYDREALGKYHLVVEQTGDAGPAQVQSFGEVRSGIVPTIDFTPDDRFIVDGTLRGEVRLYSFDPTREQPVELLDTKTGVDTVFEVRAAPNGAWIAVGTRRMLYLFRIAEHGNSAKLELIKEYEHRFVFGVDISPDGKLLLSSSRLDTAVLWRVVNGEDAENVTLEEVEKISLTEGGGRVRFSPDGKQIIAGSFGIDMWVWQLKTDGDKLSCQMIAELPHDDIAVPAGRMTPDGAQIITAAIDGKVRFWKVARKEDGSIEGITNAGAFEPGMRATWIELSEDGTTLFVTGMGGDIRVFRFLVPVPMTDTELPG